MTASPSSLPRDCLLHVFLHLDPVAIVRCAAVSRHWRWAVIDNASEIRRRLRRHLLLGLHYRDGVYRVELAFSPRSSWSPPPSAERHHHWSDALPAAAPCNVPVVHGVATNLYYQSSCSDGLILLCRGLEHGFLVCNPLTGFHASVPRPGGELRQACRYSLHSCHGVEPSPSPNSFQLLVADVDREGVLALQNYTSETGAWGPVLRPGAKEFRMAHRDFSTSPVACQGAMNFLCTNLSDYSPGQPVQVTHTVAVDIATGLATMTRLPTQCRVRKNMLMLAAFEGDRLSVIRVDRAVSLDILIWLYDGDLLGVCDSGGGSDLREKQGWMLWRSVNIQKLVEDAGLGMPDYTLRDTDWTLLETSLERFCPRSRHLVIRIAVAWIVCS